MTIEIHPPGLKRILNNPDRHRGLRNRTASVMCEECSLNQEDGTLFAGPLLDVVAQARVHDESYNGEHHLTLTEDSCSNTMVGH